MHTASRVAHAGIAVMSVKQTIAYSPILTPPHDGAGVMFLSAHGEFLWVYALLWGLSALASLYGVIMGRGRWSLLLFIFLCFCWAGGYAAAWGFSRFTSDDFMTACTYTCIVLLSAGIYRSIDLLDDKQVETTTAAIQIVRGANEPS